VLAVDNLGGSCVLGRMLRVDHVERYRLPKHVLEREEKEALEAEDDDSDEKKIGAAEAGHAYKGQELASEYDIHAGQDLFAAPKMSDRHDDNNQREDASTTHDSMDNNAMDSKAERKRRKEERAQKRKEKEEHRRRKEEQKRKKHSSRSSKDKKRRRSRSRS